MLTTGDRTPETRGILRLLPKHSWLPIPSDAVQYDDVTPFIITSAKIVTESGELFRNPCLTWKVSDHGIGNGPGDFSPDSTISSIFTTSLNITKGSAATALSTIITILSSMAYYDQFPNFQNTAHNVSTTYHETFLFPQSFRGLSAVLAITAVHYLLIMVIATAFLTSTRLTTLGDHWQSISQLVSPATASFLAKSSHATDKEIRRCLKAEHREKETSLIQPLVVEGEARIGVVARRARRRSSDGR